MPALIAGVPAPKFKLHDLESGPFSLEEALKHGPVLLVFFKISCPTCQFTLPYLERLYQGLKGKSVPAIVGISQNNQKDTAAFLRQYGVSFPVLLDDPMGYPVSNAYGITNVPTLFYIGQDGTHRDLFRRLVAQGPGADNPARRARCQSRQHRVVSIW